MYCSFLHGSIVHGECVLKYILSLACNGRASASVVVSEFACVNDNPSWAPCTDQTQINTFINDVVSYFESNDDVVAYGPSNGNGLGDVWPLTDSSGALTTSGQTYLNAIKGV